MSSSSVEWPNSTFILYAYVLWFNVMLCRGASLVSPVCWLIQDHRLEALKLLQHLALHKQTHLPLQFKHLLLQVQSKLTGMDKHYLQNLRMWILGVMLELRLLLNLCLVLFWTMLVYSYQKLEVRLCSICNSKFMSNTLKQPIIFFKFL